MSFSFRSFAAKLRTAQHLGEVFPQACGTPREPEEGHLMTDHVTDAGEFHPSTRIRHCGGSCMETSKSPWCVARAAFAIHH